MELHLALRKAVEQFGIDILNDIKIVNILLDYNAFSEKPATKNIFKAIILQGFLSEILLLSKSTASSYNTLQKPQSSDWLLKVQSIANKCAEDNGYRQDLVEYIFSNLLLGLGWKQENQSVTSSSDVYISNPLIAPVEPIQNNSKKASTQTQSYGSIVSQNVQKTNFFVLNVEPQTADIYIDNQHHTTSSGKLYLELPLGSHNIEVKAKYYKSETRVFVLKADQKTEMTIQLVLENEFAQIRFQLLNQQDEVYIGGTYLCKGNWSGLFKKGIYNVIVKRHNCIPYERNINISCSRTIFIPDLKPLNGSLKINIQPYGSQILIDGKNVGQSPLIIRELPVGHHCIAVTLLGSKDYAYSQEINVINNQMAEVATIIDSQHFSDLTKVRVGDWVYSDGTFCHIKTDADPVGIVFSLTTSPIDKAQGFTHGMILSTTNFADKCFKDVLKQSSRRLANLMYYDENDKKSQEYEKIKFITMPYYRLPSIPTSGWHLPSIAFWKLILSNLPSDTINKVLFERCSNIFHTNNNFTWYASANLREDDVVWVAGKNAQGKIGMRTLNINNSNIYIKAITAF